MVYVPSLVEPPTQPSNLVLVHVTSTTLSLAWEPPINLGGRNDLSYSVAYQQEDTQDIIPIASAIKGTFITIEGIAVFTNFRGISYNDVSVNLVPLPLHYI